MSRILLISIYLCVVCVCVCVQAQNKIYRQQNQNKHTAYIENSTTKKIKYKIKYIQILLLGSRSLDDMEQYSIFSFCIILCFSFFLGFEKKFSILIRGEEARRSNHHQNSVQFCFNNKKKNLGSNVCVCVCAWIGYIYQWKT